MKFRQARVEDVEQIQKVENEYYDGFFIPDKTLESWIRTLPENFIIAEEDDEIIGCIFFEYLRKVKAIPYVHDITKTHVPDGKYAYISEIAIKEKYKTTDVIQKLFDMMLEKYKKDKIKGIICLTGPPDRIGHDLTENQLINANGFVRKNRIKKWEAWPNFFVDDHWIWVKTIG